MTLPQFALIVFILLTLAGREMWVSAQTFAEAWSAVAVLFIGGSATLLVLGWMLI